MIWGDRPVDTTATQQLPQLDRTMPFAVVGDEDLADMRSTQTLADSPAVKHRGGHRRPHRKVLTWRQTGALAATLGAVVFVAVLASASPENPGPPAVRHAAPDATTAAPSPKPRVKPRRVPVRPAEPVVVRSMRPAPAARAPVVTVTVTATPTPKPTSPSPTKPVTPSPTPSTTPDVPPVTTDPEPTTPPAPDADETTDTETPDDDA